MISEVPGTALPPPATLRHLLLPWGNRQGSSVLGDRAGTSGWMLARSQPMGTKCRAGVPACSSHISVPSQATPQLGLRGPKAQQGQRRSGDPEDPENFLVRRKGLGPAPSSTSSPQHPSLLAPTALGTPSSASLPRPAGLCCLLGLREPVPRASWLRRHYLMGCWSE